MVKPRVLQVVRPVEGGIFIHLKNLLENLADEFSFTVACPRELAVKIKNSGTDVLALPLGKQFHPYRDLLSCASLVKKVRSEKFALIHAHGFKAGLIARPAARIGHVPCLVTVHGDFISANASRLRPLYYAAESLLSRWTTGYVAVSSWLATELVKEYGINAMVTVIPNGILLDGKKGECKDIPFAQGQPVVGTVARLAPQKGVEFFIRAAALLTGGFPGLRFLVVGDGPLRPELESLAAELGFGERLFFMGYRDDVPAILKRLDVFVQPSLSEGQGITVLEAMAAGCPVVASSVGGLREIVRHGENGLLVEPKNIKGLADAISRVLTDEVMAAALSADALESVRSFELTGMVEKTRNLYRSVTEGRWPHEML